MKRHGRYLVALVALIVFFQVFMAILWLYIDKTPPYWDEAWYLYQGAVQYNTLCQDGISAWYKSWITLERIRPSLVPVMTIPFFALFGISSDIGLVVNIVALITLAIFLYLLAVSMSEKFVGALAVTIMSSYYIIIGLTHILLVEVVMIALVAATLLALWRSKGFHSTAWSVFAGFCLGLGLLSKVFYVIFVIGPCFITLISSFRSHGHWTCQPQRLRNLGLCVAAALLCTVPWYGHNLKEMTARSVDAAIGVEAAAYGPAHPLALKNLLGYFINFINFDTSIICFIVFLIGIVGLVLPNPPRHIPCPPDDPPAQHALLFLSSSILFGYIIFSSLPNQDMKNVTGILPTMAILSGWGIARLTRRGWEAAVLCPLLIIMVFHSLIGTVPNTLGNPQYYTQINGHKLFWVFSAWPMIGGDPKYMAPSSVPWPTQEIMNYIVGLADRDTSSGPVRVGLIPDYPGLDSAMFQFEAYRWRVPLDAQPADPARISDYEVLLTKTGDLGWPTRRPEMEKILQMLGQPGSGFQRMPRTIGLPDGSQVIFYRRGGTP